jgi:small subunit ribosomal protein S20
LANHKSAIKRIRQTRKRTIRNRFVRSTMRTFIRRVREAVATGDKTVAAGALVDAVRKIDKAASKGVIHRNQASRRVSRLTKLVNGMGA